MDNQIINNISNEIIFNEYTRLKYLNYIIPYKYDGDINFNELYKFNNSSSVFLNVVEDTLKPWFDLYVDSVAAFNGMVTHTQPVFNIKIYFIC